MSKTKDFVYDESARGIEDEIAEIWKDVPVEAFDNVVSDPVQERRDLIAIRDAAIELAALLSGGQVYCIDPFYGVELSRLKAMIDAQQYPDTHN